MKVALVSELPRVPSGHAGRGPGDDVLALGAALIARGHDVTVYTRADAATLADVPAVAYRDAADLARRWRANPPDLVHSHFAEPGIGAMDAARSMRLPMVHTFHTLAAPPSSVEGRDAPARLAAGATHVIANSTELLERLVHSGLDRRRVTMVPDGVDVDRFQASPWTPSRTDAKSCVLAVGPLTRNRGLDTLVTAMTGLADARLVIATDSADAQRSKPERRRLLALAQDLSVLDRVRLVAETEPAALLGSADVVAHVPWRDPVGLIVLQAMASGVPVVAGAVAGHVDAVVDGVTGLLVRPRHPRELMLALRKVIGDPFVGDSMRVAAFDRARSRYSWPRIASDTESVYDRVLARF